MLPPDVTVEITPDLLEELTFGEHEELQAIAGEDYDALLRGQLRPKALTALAYVQLRRRYPDVTLDDVRALKLSVVRPAGTEPNPTGAGS